MIFCDNCGKIIKNSADQYTIQIEMFAKPAPIVIDDKELQKDHLSEMEDIIKNLEQMNDEEVNEATDQVWESYSFTICSSCRIDFHKKFKQRVKKR